MFTLIKPRANFARLKQYSSQLSAFYSTQNSVDQSQLEHFNAMTNEWWNKDGCTKLLHLMNNVRVPFIRDGLTDFGNVKKDLLNIATPLAGINILDVGCGAGILSEALAKIGGNVTAIDPSQELIQCAKHHASLSQSLGNNLTYQSTIEAHAIRSMERYDVLVSSEVVEHIPQWEDFVQECVKCVKPGGSIFITTINKTIASLFGVVGFYELVNIIPKGTHQWRMLVPPQDLERILKECNCRVVNTRGMFYNPFTSQWSWTKNLSNFYALHAIKNPK